MDISHGYWPEHEEAETARLLAGQDCLAYDQPHRICGPAEGTRLNAECGLRTAETGLKHEVKLAVLAGIIALVFSFQAMAGPTIPVLHSPAIRDDGGNPQLFTALGEFESGANDLAVGAGGEVSRYQITPSVWREYTALPLTSARNPFIALNVARAIMEDRARRILHTQLSSLNPQQFYLLWNKPARAGRPRPMELERAKRFENLARKLND
jgi:hypothetical protein